MKKIFLSLIALMATMSINAQVVKVYENGSLSATYTNSDEHTYKVVFEEVPREYVEIGGLKWATMNLGATTVAGSPSTCYGDYYAWGETEPRYTSITISGANSVSFGGWSNSHSSGYSSSDSPSYTGTTLDADHDAATKNWGSDWRTPTNTDFQALAKACTGSTKTQTISTLSSSTPAGGIYWLPSDQTYLSEYKGVAGILFVDRTDTDKRVFFPAAGGCDGIKFDHGGTNGLYWSSSLYTLNDGFAYRQSFESSEITPSYSSYRYYGFTVRPVSGNITLVTSITLDNTSLSIEVGRKNTLTATIMPEDASTKTVTWTSSDESVATVSSEGVVTAVAAGTVTITAAANDCSGVSATCAVTVPSHEYVEIGDLKWATMNLGATTVAGSPSTCYGDYYAWGETEPRYTSITISGDGTSVSFGGWSNSHSSGYSSSDYPTYTGTTLDADHDAATQNWGAKWRTPTHEDYVKLYEACGGTGDNISPFTALPIGTTTTTDKGIYWCNDYDGVKGLLFSDGTNKVFFPAAGSCYKTSFSDSGSDGLYWSSSLYTSDNSGAYNLIFSSLDYYPSGVYPSYAIGRYLGLTVRPVSE